MLESVLSLCPPGTARRDCHAQRPTAACESAWPAILQRVASRFVWRHELPLASRATPALTLTAKLAVTQNGP